MGAIASQITSLTIVYSTVYSDADQRKHQSPASLAFVRGIHRRPVNSPHKLPVTRKMFPFDDVIVSEFDMEFKMDALSLFSYNTVIIVCVGSANERRRYHVMSYLIGWAHTLFHKVPIIWNHR